VRFALIQGCTELKAITTPGNKESIAFHRSLGMELTGKQNAMEFKSSKIMLVQGRTEWYFEKH
jgi:hypothetical protein